MHGAVVHCGLLPLLAGVVRDLRFSRRRWALRMSGSSVSRRAARCEWIAAKRRSAQRRRIPGERLVEEWSRFKFGLGIFIQAEAHLRNPSPTLFGPLILLHFVPAVSVEANAELPDPLFSADPLIVD